MNNNVCFLLLVCYSMTKIWHALTFYNLVIVSLRSKGNFRQFGCHSIHMNFCMCDVMWMSACTPTHRSTCSWLARWVTKSVMWRVGTGIIALASRGSCWSTASWTSLTAELICQWTESRSQLKATSLNCDFILSVWKRKLNWQLSAWEKLMVC